MTRTSLVGLTGGIGSGKSTVAEMFALLGAAVVDTDAIAHALTAPGGAAMPPSPRRSVPHSSRADGALDRQQMRERVFRDPAAQARWRRSCIREIRECDGAGSGIAKAAAAPYVDIRRSPADRKRQLAQPRLDRVLVVDCPPATQAARVCSARLGADVGAWCDQASRSSACAGRRRLDNAGDVLRSTQGALELQRSYRACGGCTAASCERRARRRRSPVICSSMVIAAARRRDPLRISTHRARADPAAARGSVRPARLLHCAARSARPSRRR